jgi:hypothetical protein
MFCFGLRRASSSSIPTGCCGIDTAIAFGVVAALHVWRFSGWILAGVAVSVGAALVQASGFALHRHFNHNDLYHVIQIAAMLLLYRGARELRDY